MSDFSVERRDDHVAVVEFSRPPHNHFSVGLLNQIADAYDELDADPDVRAVVLCSAGKHFCAGADFGTGTEMVSPDLYLQAARLFDAKTPQVAAVQGAAVGGGLGLALSADFRVAAPDTRFMANFARLGIHQGFGLSVTLPETVGRQKAMELLYTGRSFKGEEAAALGLVDRLAADRDAIRGDAIAFGAEIAASAPLAVASIRATLRGGLADRVRAATDHEVVEQRRLIGTADFTEGVAATSERREPRFTAS